MKIKYVALWIIAACAAMMGLQLAFGTEMFVLQYATKWSEPYRLISSMFAHSGMLHLLQNIFAIGLFGLILEGRIGPLRTAIVYFSAGLLVNLFSTYPSSLGASAAAFGLIGALVVLRPQFTVWFAGVPMPMFVAGIAYAVIDIGGLFVPSRVAHLAHIGGLVVGLAFGIYWRKWMGLGDRWKPFFKKRSAFDARVDEALNRWEDHRQRR